VWSIPSDELSVAEMTEILAKLRKEGFAAVEVSGGEPFLRSDLLEILEVLDGLGFLYSVNTNGTLLTPELIHRLDSRVGLLQLAISLDSLSPERYAQLRGTDSLPRVLQSLDMISVARPRFPVKLNVTMSRMNRDEILDILALAKGRGLGVSVFPVVRGVGHAHRADDPALAATDAELAEMAELFKHLAVLRRAGEPLWEYSGYYDVAAEYVSGHSIGECDAGRVFFDLRANGDLAACVDLPAFASLRTDDAGAAMARVENESARIRECSATTPCCYTCTANITETAQHPVRFALEEARVRMRAAQRRWEQPR